MPEVLNREGITKLTLVHTQAQLAHIFGISLPTYRAYMRGREPREAITVFINNKVHLMLNGDSQL